MVQGQHDQISPAYLITYTFRKSKKIKALQTKDTEKSDQNLKKAT